MKITSMALGAYQANCYLIADEEAKLCVLIDPGDQANIVEQMLAKSGCNLAFIALTHGHSDHRDAVTALLANHPNTPVYLHPADNDLGPGQGISPAIDPALLTPIKDGDILPFGSSQLKVIHTPGHSLGSVTFQLSTTLFTGDTLFRGSMGRTDFPGGNYTQIMASLKRLGKLEGDYQVLAGHMDGSTMEQERKSNYYLREAMGT